MGIGAAVLGGIKAVGAGAAAFAGSTAGQAAIGGALAAGGSYLSSRSAASNAPGAPQVPGGGESYGSWLDAYASPWAIRARQTAALGDIKSEDALSREAASRDLARQRDLAPQYYETQAALERDYGDLWAGLQREQAGREIETVGQLAPAFREALGDPQTERIRSELGRQIEAELAAGATLDPAMQRQVEESIRSAQTARGLSRGAGPVNAEALYKGFQAQQLRQQRQQAATQFLQTQAQTMADPWTAITGQSTAMQQGIFNPPNVQGIQQGVAQAGMAGLGAQQESDLLNAQLMNNYNQMRAANQPDYGSILSGLGQGIMTYGLSGIGKGKPGGGMASVLGGTGQSVGFGQTPFMGWP